jgi:hypothetical protein
MICPTIVVGALCVPMAKVASTIAAICVASGSVVVFRTIQADALRHSRSAAGPPVASIGSFVRYRPDKNQLYV